MLTDTFLRQNAGDAPVLVLAPRLDLTAARALSASLRERAGGPLQLDASQVESLGGLCLQVLLAAGQRWRRDGFALRITPVSAAFGAALEQFGLAPGVIENGAAA